VDINLNIFISLGCCKGLETCGVETTLVGGAVPGGGGTDLVAADEGSEHRNGGSDDGDGAF
jgi:hypothetical protein